MFLLPGVFFRGWHRRRRLRRIRRGLLLGSLLGFLAVRKAGKYAGK